ncbi:ABC transporter permease [Leucobacter rhizosphaerae]|uniref:Transport permease protein n=1 Tax=Leucobacter rhizosphaerae TaxID=2932245 RepID=A0ABY4FUH4_9MICO|nr:ABC transporter permease [Leucobacter rhizosphaerae]UOQ59920.1 ABC transporter permease [Leucobacter rhizosphaerae]
MQFFKELWASRELLANLVLRETRGQYKRTVLGRLWSLLNPLASMLIYTFIFSMVFRIQPEAGDPSGLNIFPIWLMCGLLPWGFFAGSLNATSNSLLANTGLITKVYFPRSVLPLAAVGTLGMNWMLEMLVLVIALLLVGSQVLIWIPGTLLLMLLLAMFASGLGWILAIVTIHFRDTQYLLGILLQLWMYLTPIIYPASLIRDMSDRFGGLLNTNITVFDLYTLNPMYHFVTAFRQLLYDNRWPDTIHLVTCVGWTAAAVLVGVFVFNRSEKKIAEML